MKTKGLSALAVVAILLAAVLAPAMGMGLLDNSNSTFNENESVTPVPTLVPTPSPTPTIVNLNLSDNLKIIGNDSFSANETPEFVIEIQQDFIDAISDADSGEPVEIQIYVEGGDGSRIEVFVEEEEIPSSSNIIRYHVTIPNHKTEELKPGTYTLVVEVSEQSMEHLFKWGLEPEPGAGDEIEGPLNLSKNLKIIGNDSFSAEETPEFVIEIEQDFIDAISDADSGEPVEIQPYVEDCNGSRIGLFVEEICSNKFKVTIPNNKTGLGTEQITPGTYTLVVVVGEQSMEHTFEWGLEPEPEPTNITVSELGDVVSDSTSTVTSTSKPVIIMFKDKSDAELILKQHGGKIKSVYRLKPALAASLPQKAIDALRKNTKIDFVVDDLEIFTMGETLDWGVDRIDADVAHESNNNGTGINVAILDTGIDYNHPDLAANYEGGYDFGGNYSGAPNDANPMDSNGHGTHCAGIVAAVKGNGIGVIGVAPEVDLYAVKVFTDDGYGRYSDIIEALEWCIDTRTDGDPDNDIQVISMSFGSKYSAGDPGIESWINAAYDAGILLVGAAGNDGKLAGVGDNVGYPARYESVIAVAATDINDNRASFSSTGPAVELAAPGVSINSTYLGGEYVPMSGTSMACPVVSGTAALVIASNSSLTNVDVRVRLQETAEDLGAAGKDTKYGYGLVNASEAASPTGGLPDEYECPVVATPRTYDNTTLEEKTVFGRNDSMFINVSVTDANGASDLDSVLITILNTTNATIVNNDTMTQSTPITDGYVYNYFWMVPGDADSGTWTLKVYANDTPGNVGSASVQFVVNHTNATAPENKNITVDLIATKEHFALNENPEFTFIVNSLNTTVGEFKAKADETDAGLGAFDFDDPKTKKALKTLVTSEETIKTSVYYKDELIDLEPEIVKLGEGDFNIKIPSKRAFRAGLYKLKVELVKDNVTYVEEQEFEWGLVSLNTKKSIYKPCETAEFIIVVLDKAGHPVCDTDVSLVVTNPNNEKAVYSTADGTILPGNEYGIYNANYPTEVEGNHTMDTSALIGGTEVAFSTYFLVQQDYEFDIIRTARSKIDPIKQDWFDVAIDIESFVGAANAITIKEFVPAEFDLNTDADIIEAGDTKILTWNKNLVGNKTSVSYSYSVPHIWPYLYALGPVEIGYGSETFSEARAWYVAVDPTETRYMRSDQQIINGLTAYKLAITQSDTSASNVIERTKAGGDTVNWGTRVWKRDSGGTEYEITGGTPVAQVSRTNTEPYEGLLSAAWDCPQTSLNSTDAIVVRVYAEILSIGSWTEQATFTTEQLGASQLDAASWTVNYYTKYESKTNGPSGGRYTRGTFYWGTSTYNSRIGGFSWTEADTESPQWSNATTNKTTIYQNDYVKFSVNWTDGVGLTGYKFSINQTGAWVNSSFTDFSGTSNISENVTQITASAGTTVGWRFYANDTSDNWNVTDIQTFVVESAEVITPRTPFMIYGCVFYEDGSECNGSTVNITNLNTSKQWLAETNASYNYYQLILANGTDLNASEILQFNTSDGIRYNVTNYTVTQENITDGGLFNFNLTVPEPPKPSSPFVIYGWVLYEDGSECNGSIVNVTNTNTSMHWLAETNASYNFYQLILDTTNVSEGNVLSFNTSDGIRYNVTNHPVTQENITNGGLFKFNLTVPEPPKPSTPFMIYGWVFYEDGSKCNGSIVNVTNTNTSMHWQAETNVSYNFYQLILDTTNVSEGNVLEFNTSDGIRYNVTNYTVTQENITGGGLFEFNLTVPTPPTPSTPFMIYGWVFYEDGSECLGPMVNVTNTNMSVEWKAETNASYNYYRLILDTTNVSTGNVLEFNATDGTEFNVTNHRVTQENITDGGLFNCNLTLPSVITEGPDVVLVEVTPDPVTMAPCPTATMITVNATVSDPNGWDNIKNVNITSFNPSISGVSLPIEMSKIEDINPTTAKYQATVELPCCTPADTYTVTVEAKDQSDATDIGTDTFTVDPTRALSINFDKVSFSGDPNSTNNSGTAYVGGSEVTDPEITSMGNDPIDIGIFASNLTKAGAPDIDGNNMEATIGGTPDWHIVKPEYIWNTNLECNTATNTGFRLDIPLGTPEGTYTGSIVITPWDASTKT